MCVNVHNMKSRFIVKVHLHWEISPGSGTATPHEICDEHDDHESAESTTHGYRHHVRNIVTATIASFKSRSITYSFKLAWQHSFNTANPVVVVVGPTYVMNVRITGTNIHSRRLEHDYVLVITAEQPTTIFNHSLSPAKR